MPELTPTSLSHQPEDLEALWRLPAAAPDTEVVDARDRQLTTAEVKSSFEKMVIEAAIGTPHGAEADSSSEGTPPGDDDSSAEGAPGDDSTPENGQPVNTFNS